MGMVIAAAIVGAAALTGSVIAARKAKKQREAMQKKANSKEGRMDRLEANRQSIIDPFSGMKNLSEMVSNPYANLQVATEAAEFQAEESDIALANTLDVLRATGSGAGGATALAQGALRSKRGISTTIGQQEAQNDMSRATGEANAQTMRFNESRRLQAMRAQGKQYMFETQENRDIASLDRLAGLATGYQSAANAAAMQEAQIIGTAVPQAVSAFSSVYQPG